MSTLCIVHRSSREDCRQRWNRTCNRDHFPRDLPAKNASTGQNRRPYQMTEILHTVHTSRLHGPVTGRTARRLLRQCWPSQYPAMFSKTHRDHFIYGVLAVQMSNMPKGRDRNYVACHRCRGQKIKCTGGTPCTGCQRANAVVKCTYPERDRKVSVSAKYVPVMRYGLLGETFADIVIDTWNTWSHRLATTARQYMLKVTPTLLRQLSSGRPAF